MAFSKRLLIVFFAGCSIVYSLFSLYRIIRSFAGDFFVYYHAGLSNLHGLSLYHKIFFTLFNYPPISAFVYIPFAILPFVVAQALFVIASFLSAWVAVWLCCKILNTKVSFLFYLTGIALFLLSFPTKFTLGMGQSNLIAYALLLFTVWLDKKNKTIFSGVLLAFAIIFKPILIICVLYFVLKRSWKVIFACILTGMSLTLVQLLVLPQTFHEWQLYLTSILPGLFTTKGREIYYNQGLLGTISRITQNTLIRKFGTWILSLILLFDVGKNILKTKNQDNLHLALLLCILPLIDSLSWQHHFVILLFPMLYAWYQLQHTKIGLGLLGVSYVLISTNIKNPQLFVHFPLNILSSHVFWGTLLLLGLLLYCAKLSKHIPSSRA